MPDREKVIKTIQNRINEARNKQLKVATIFVSTLSDILALLQEQEAVGPTLIREGRNKNYNDYVCPRCDNEVVYEQNYCSECGVRFLWEGR